MLIFINYLVLEEAGSGHYSKLQRPNEEKYAEAFFTGAPFKAKSGTLLHEMCV